MDAATADDVIIVGAGPAGLATAIGLRAHGFSLQVVERAPAAQFRVGETVPADICRSLHDLGAWPEFCSQGHLPSLGQASAWGTSELARVDALSKPGGAGWHLDRMRFEQLLERRAHRVGATVRRGLRAIGVTPRNNGWLVRTSGNGGASTHSARVLVDATGRHATVARWLGAPRHVYDRLICAYALFDQCDRWCLEGRALVESAPDGWWYATPLPGDRALAALHTDPRTFRSRHYADPFAWHAALRHTVHVDRSLGRPAPPSRIYVTTATSHCLEQPAGADWIAVGDAAASYDPLASAGLTLALRDGLSAAAAVAAYRSGSHDALMRRGVKVRQRFESYRLERAAYYALECRWRASAFWRDRSTPPTDLSPDFVPSQLFAASAAPNTVKPPTTKNAAVP